MNLDYIFNNNASHTTAVQNQGYDLDSVLFLGKDLILLLQDLEIPPSGIFSFMQNLKIVQDSVNGKAYEIDSEENPMKVTVTEPSKRSTLTFSYLGLQDRVPFYTCCFCHEQEPKDQITAHAQGHFSSPN
jgi:hypothetical protein